MWSKLSGCVGAVACLACESSPNTCDLLKTWVDGDRLYVVGTLNTHAHTEISDMIGAHPELRTIVLQNVPGTTNVDATLMTAALIHAKGLNTHVPKGGLIASGGVDLFCGGRERTVEPGVWIGVHSWSSGEGVTGDSLEKSDAEHASQVTAFESLGCPVSFYWYTVNAAPADGMYYMTREDLAVERVVTKFVKYLP